MKLMSRSLIFCTHTKQGFSERAGWGLTRGQGGTRLQDKETPPHACMPHLQGEENSSSLWEPLSIKLGHTGVCVALRPCVGCRIALKQ